MDSEKDRIAIYRSVFRPEAPVPPSKWERFVSGARKCVAVATWGASEWVLAKIYYERGKARKVNAEADLAELERIKKAQELFDSARTKKAQVVRPLESGEVENLEAVDNAESEIRQLSEELRSAYGGEVDIGKVIEDIRAAKEATRREAHGDEGHAEQG